MAYLPVKAMSECVTPMNGSAGGVFESSRIFHAASAAGSTMIFLVVSLGHRAMVPGRRPTRGSGLGADADMLVVDGAEDAEDDDVAHAVACSRATASDAVRSGVGFTL